MAIVFLKKKKIQQSLILIFILVIIITIIVIWKGFFKKETPSETSPSLPNVIPIPRPEIEIDYKIFKNPLLKELKPFHKIQPLEGKPGRENPFLPY